MPSRFLILLLSLALLAPAGLTQIGLIVGSTVDIEAATLASSGTINNGALGIVELNGRIFVTSRGAGAVAPHLIYEFDGTGTIISTYQQSTGANATLWGYRDGATDGTYLYFGYDNGVMEVIDPDPLSPNYSFPAAGAPAAPAVPVPGSGFTVGGIGTFRGMAHDPNGDGGGGSLWTADFASTLNEISLTATGTAGVAGAILNQFPMVGNWSIYGLARDPQLSTSTETRLWANSVPNLGPLAEIVVDRTLVTATVSGASMARQQVGVAQGGISPVGPNSPILTAAYPGTVYIALDQGVPDAYSLYDGSGVGALRTGVNGGLQTLTQTIVQGSGTLDWDLYSQPIGSAGITLQPAMTIGNLGVVGTPPAAMTPGVPGLAIEHFVSIPPGVAGFVLADGLTFGGLAPFIGLNLHGFLPGDLVLDDPGAGSIPSIPLPTGTAIYLQTIYIDGVGALKSSNMSGWNFAPPISVVVEANGTNSYNADPTSGFFTVLNLTGVDITQVQFDWTASLNPGQATMEFDTDQTLMADRFDGGNSLLLGTCGGTYRNGTDVSTGLDYSGTPVSPCDPSANTGWLGTNPTTAPSYRTVTFNFVAGQFNMPNEVFEVDIDTDLGLGITGGAMDGMVITITLAGGGVVTGMLVADPVDPNKSSASL